MPTNLENSAVATGLEKVSFHSNPKERQCQRMFKLLYYTIALSSLASKVMLKILQSKFQKCVNGELPAGSTSWILKRQRNQRSNCQHLLDHQKAREFQENIYFFFIDYVKAFDCVDHTKLWKILKEMGIPDQNTRFTS